MDTRVRKPPSHPMPEVAQFVRTLREAFGDDVIDRAIETGKSGEPSFYACENGRSVGTAAPSAWRVDESLRGGYAIWGHAIREQHDILEHERYAASGTVTKSGKFVEAPGVLGIFQSEEAKECGLRSARAWVDNHA